LIRKPRGYDRDRRDDRDDAPRERPKLQLSKRTAPVENAGETGSSAIFGGAKPVDTTAKEREIEEKLQKQAAENAKNNERTKKLSERSSDNDDNAAPAKNIFGQAKPVDTTKREREIEEKLKRVDVNEDDKPSHKSEPKKIEKRPQRSPPPMKKAEEAKAPNFVASNKYAFLPDEEDVGSGKEDSD